MEANNTTDKVRVYKFHPIKYNKHDTIYQGDENNPRDSFITELVKIEKFQGFSKAYNLGLYFRIKNESSWAKSKSVTGLWKTNHKGVYYGNNVTTIGKTLLIFKTCLKTDLLSLYEFTEGYNPSRTIIDKLINQILSN
jgi:hypothetical protein